VTAPTFSVTEVVTATRCPRQLVLSKKGTRVVPYGADAFGTAAHVALAAVASGARTDTELHRLLDSPLPDRGAVVKSLFRLALGGAHAHAKKVANRVDGGDLSRFADTVLRLATMLAEPLTRLAGDAANGEAAVASVFLASEEEVTLTVADTTIRGRIDLMCRDSAHTWLWDLKTYAGTHEAELEQVRVYAMAYAEMGKKVRPALVHVTRDRIEVRNADPVGAADVVQLGKLVKLMGTWVEGSPPPPAPDLGTCRSCPARSECWRTWGRTLPDENDVVRPPTLPPPAVAVSSPAPAAKGTAPTAPPARAGAPPTGTTPPARAAGSEWSPAAVSPLFVGFDPKRAPVCLDPMDLTRHVAVFGAAGSGKTYFAKSIVEEAVLAGIPVIAFDVQGDILTLAEPLGDDAVEAPLRARRDAYRERAELRLLTPLSDAGLRVAMNPMRFPKGELTDERRAVVAEAVADNLLSHAKTTPATRDHVRAYLAAHLASAMERARSLTIGDLIAGIAAEEDEDDELLDAKARKKLVKDLKLLTMGVKAYTFREGRPLDLDALVAPSRTGKTPVNVLWLNGFADQQSKESFVAMVLADVYSWMLGQRGGGPRVLLYFDEIGPYMPPSGEPPTKKLLKRIFKEGRKYGVCGLFCTQNFVDVDYKVVSQANTICVGRVNAAQEKKKAVESFGAPPNFDIASAVTSLVGGPQGRFLVRQASGKVDWVHGRKLVTRHGPVWGEDEIRDNTSDEARRAWDAEDDAAG